MSQSPSHTHYSPSFVLDSPAFGPGEDIPERYTCEGEGLSPPLRWIGFPQSTRAFALVVEDPDANYPGAPQGAYVHWIVFNLPASVTSLEEGVKKLPGGARFGLNQGGQATFGGPCPPRGRHRYRHRIYALDDFLRLSSPDKKGLERAMEGHVLGMAELVGFYEKRKAA
jgi:Raf kinase inhibitor-like YbhB/YbcL family protein